MNPLPDVNRHFLPIKIKVMTEESYQQCRKVMQKINYLRGLITTAKGEVAKWSNIESSFREKLQESRADGAKKMLEKATTKLNERREKFAAMKFPESDITIEVNRCKECGVKIATGNNYCGECMCEDDSDY